MRQAHIDPENDEQVGGWLSEKVVWQGHEASRLHQAVLWLWRAQILRMAYEGGQLAAVRRSTTSNVEALESPPLE